MPTTYETRARQRAEMKPLIEELQRLFMAEHMLKGTSHEQVGRECGMTGYQVGRVLGEALPAPTFLDIIRLAIRLGLTPNEAAHLVGLYPESENRQDLSGLPSYEQRVLHLLREDALEERDKLTFIWLLEALVKGIRDLRAEAVESPQARLAQ